MHLKNDKEILLMRLGGQILSQVLDKLSRACKPGVKTSELDQIAEEMILALGAQPAFKGFKNYPFTTCISVNEELVHGLPSSRVIRSGDIVGIDVGVRYQGYCTDAAKTIIAGEATREVKKIVEVAELSLKKAINLSKPGVRIQTIQKEIQETIESSGFGVVQALTGHGIGKILQEDPMIANYVRKDYDFVLKPGMTFTYEPMLTMGDWSVKTLDDGWTVISSDKSLTAHFEHTIAITQKGNIVLTN